jgi:leader peptidase (prepilin peptidase)/N-methyltransferase
MPDNPLPALTAIVMTPWGLGILGLCIGSFLNVVIHRMPKMLERQWQADARAMLELPEATGDATEALTLSKPASRCPSCGHKIRWFENIPLVSWLVLRGLQRSHLGALPLDRADHGRAVRRRWLALWL